MIPESQKKAYKFAFASVVFATLAGYLVYSLYQSDEDREERRQCGYVWKSALLAATDVDGQSTVSDQVGTVFLNGGPVNCLLTHSVFVWAVPNGIQVPLNCSSEKKIRFFAHSEKTNSDGLRYFVFPAPVYCRKLRDSDVDWHTHNILQRNDTGEKSN